MTKKTTTTPATNPGKASSHAENSPPASFVENEMGKYPSLVEIKELIEFVSKKEFNEFELERGAFRLRWRKGAPEQAPSSNRLPANIPHPISENRTAELAQHAPAAT